MMTIIGSSVNLLFCISRFRELLKKNRFLRKSPQNSRKQKIENCGNTDEYRVYETFATLLVVLNVDGSSPSGHPSKKTKEISENPSK